MLKMVNSFEFKKREEQTLRDFRVSLDTTVRNAFLLDFEAVKSRFIFASPSGARCLSVAVPFGIVLAVMLLM